MSAADFQTARNVCFTLHDDDWTPDMIDQASIRYCIVQREIGLQDKKLHWQGYVEFPDSYRKNRMKRILGSDKVHLEKRMAKEGKGGRDAARDYCTPDAPIKKRNGLTKRQTGEYVDGPWIFGN